MSFIAIFNAANEPNFQNRCRVATWIAAQNIVAEDPATPNHEVRKAWAQRVLADEAKITDRQLAVQALRNPQISADPTGTPDDSIQYQVNSVIDSIIAIG